MLRNRTLNSHLQEPPEMRSPSAPSTPAHGPLQIPEEVTIGSCPWAGASCGPQNYPDSPQNSQCGLTIHLQDGTESAYATPGSCANSQSSFWNLHTCLSCLKHRPCEWLCSRAVGTRMPAPRTPPGAAALLSPLCPHCPCSLLPREPFTPSSFLQISGQVSFS